MRLSRPPVFVSSVHMLVVVSMASRLPPASKPRRTTPLVLAPGVPTSVGATPGLFGSGPSPLGGVSLVPTQTLATRSRLS